MSVKGKDSCVVAVAAAVAAVFFDIRKINKKKTKNLKWVDVT